jgi:hypothetical protein
MDHSDVVRLQAVEKYVLGELPVDVRDQFEEHYFDCAECAKDVNCLATFLTASRVVLEESTPAKVSAPDARQQRREWFAWMRPVIAVPAMAGLLAIVVFQNVVTIPSLRQHTPAAGSAAVYSSSYRLQGATRGDNLAKVVIGPNESFALDFDFTPAVPYQSYTGNLVDRRGNTMLRFRVNGEMANKELHVVVPGDKVEAGNYDLVFSGDNDGSNGDPRTREVQRIPFAVEFRP